jgi:hypothetical protein
LEAGLLDSIQGIYNFLVGKFQYDRLNAYVAKFMDKYKDNQLIMYLMQMMLEPVESNRPDFLTLQAGLPSWFDVQVAIQYDRGSQLVDKLVTPGRNQQSSLKSNDPYPLDDSFINNTSKEDPSMNQIERKSVGRITESKIIGSRDNSKGRSTFGQNNRSNDFRNQDLASPLKQNRVDLFANQNLDEQAQYYTFEAREQLINNNYNTQKNSNNGHYPDSNSYKGHQRPQAYSYPDSHPSQTFKQDMEHFSTSVKPNNSPMVIKDIRSSDNEDLYEKNHISKYLRGANGNIYKSMEDSRIEKNDKGELVEKIFIKYVPVSSNEMDEAERYLERKSVPRNDSPDRRGISPGKQTESIVLPERKNEFLENDFEMPKPVPEQPQPTKQTLSQFLKNYSQNAK